MNGRLVLLSGVGTSIGKTHVAEALLLAWGRVVPHARVVGLKPIESGVTEETETDASRLARASTFHVKHARVALRAPVSPHLAARREGVLLPLSEIVAQIAEIRVRSDGVLVELPGGLFTPIDDRLVNADLASLLTPDVTLLVVPDRLGVLHDTIAACRAASLQPFRIDGLVVVAPEHPDASTGTNAPELPRFTGVPVLAVLPRATPQELSLLPALERLVATCGSASAAPSAR